MVRWIFLLAGSRAKTSAAWANEKGKHSVYQSISFRNSSLESKLKLTSLLMLDGYDAGFMENAVCCSSTFSER